MTRSEGFEFTLDELVVATPEPVQPVPLLPEGWLHGQDSSGNTYYFNTETNEVTFDCPTQLGASGLTAAETSQTVRGAEPMLLQEDV